MSEPDALGLGTSLGSFAKLGMNAFEAAGC